MFASNLLSLLLGSLALVSAAPSAKRAPGPWCDGLGAGAFDVVPKFTLAAYFVDEPNANTTGVPLVLGAGGAIPGASFRILSVRCALSLTLYILDTDNFIHKTFATFPSNDFPSLSMDAGGIFAHSADGTNTATNGNVFDGTLPGFILTFPPTQPPQIYCAVVSIIMSSLG